MIARLGRATVTEIRRTISYATLGVLTVMSAVRRPTEGGRVVSSQIARQIVFSAWDAMPLVALIGGLITVSLVAVLSTLAPAVETPELLGRVLTYVLVREVAPLMTAIIVLLRSCSAVTVELGYMSWRGEVEALETLAIDPARFLLLPRFVGLGVAVAVLGVVFVLSAFAAGFATAQMLSVAGSVEHMTEHLLLYLTPADVMVGVAKAVVFGLIIASVACYHGLSVRRDITEVPRRTTRALVEALVHCTLTSVAITLIAL